MQITVGPIGGEDKCEVCGKCVYISLRSDALDHNAPRLDSQCHEPGCPINAKHRPGPIDIVTIDFIDCD